MHMESTTPEQRLELDRQNVRDRFLLVDGHALIYRAYHAFPELTDETGMLVNAVYGFSRILLTTLRDFHPEYVAVCFDSKEKTKRAEEYAEYKAHRPEMPDDLKPQIEVIRSVVTALNIPQFIHPGLEADDLIGAVTKQVYSKKAGSQATPESDQQPLTVILTGDKDLLQLVDDNVRVFIPARSQRQGDIEYDSGVVERLVGLRPDQIVDYKALMGDSSDNIPGVKGVGPKTAVALIQQFNTLDGVYQAVEQAEQTQQWPSPLTKGLVRKLSEEKEQAYLSQKLARIDRSHQLEFDLDQCRVTKYNKEEAQRIFLTYGFRSLVPLLPKDDFELGVQAALF